MVIAVCRCLARFSILGGNGYLRGLQNNWDAVVAADLKLRMECEPIIIGCAQCLSETEDRSFFRSEKFSWQDI